MGRSESVDWTISSVKRGHLTSVICGQSSSALTVTDITYVATAEGWLYLAGITDLYTCEVVGHARGGRMTTDLVSHALVRAVWAKRPRPGLIHHSDRVAQDCAQDYQDQLRQFGLTPSMSRKGNCYDNAPMESFWGTLKNELVHHRRYDTREQAQRKITDYLEILYNASASAFTTGESLPCRICPAVGPSAAGGVRL